MKNINSFKIIGGSKRKDYYKKIALKISSKISMLGLLNRKDIFKIYSESHMLNFIIKI